MLRQIKTESNQESMAFSTRNLSIRLRRDLSAFHEEECGASGSIDNVMMVFVAAIILIGLVTMFNTEIWTTVTEKITSLLGESVL